MKSNEHFDFSLTPARRSISFLYTPAQAGEALVSIVTPFFNTGSVFHETARSVLTQSFQRWEWLIVNDGSSEVDALAVLEAYRVSDPRIRVIDLPRNVGLSGARNAGFEQARTDFVVQIDSDDLLEPTAIEKWLWFLMCHPRAAFVKGFTVGFGTQNYLWTKGPELGPLFLSENQIDATAMIRRCVHQAVGGYDAGRRGGLEDWDFWLRCADAGRWGGTVPEFLAWYRRRDDHGERWSSWNALGVKEFQRSLRHRFPRLHRRGGFPIFSRLAERHFDEEAVRKIENPLAKKASRLLLFVPWLRPGGADKCNLDVIQQLQARGWEVTVVASLEAPHEWQTRFTELTSDVFVLPNFLCPSAAPVFIEYLIESRSPDVVLLSNTEFVYELLPWLRRRFPSLTLMDLNHMEEEAWRGGGYPRMGIDCGSLLDRQIVVSEHLRRWMVDRGGRGDQIEVCYLNVDEEHWRPDPAVRAAVRAELEIPAQQPVIAYVGRICRQKQPQVFARTVAELARRGLEFTALVVGDGEDLAMLRKTIERGPAANRVIFLGLQPNVRVQALVQASDLFFLPSEWEGIALSIYEAMACGLAVVGADVGGQRELIMEECGVLLPRDTPEREALAYADRIADILCEPDRLRRMGVAARQRVEAAFRLEMMGERLDELLSSERSAGASGREPREEEAADAKRRAVQLLDLQWKAAWRESEGGGAIERWLASLPLPRRIKGYLPAIYRIWRVGGGRAVVARVLTRLKRAF